MVGTSVMIELNVSKIRVGEIVFGEKYEYESHMQVAKDKLQNPSN